MSVRERIEELTKHETDSVAHFSAASYGDLLTPAERVRAARTLLRLQPDGSLIDFRDWGIYVSDLPILWQLTVQPSLIVDVWPMSLGDFSLRYGVRPDQFATLAAEGFVMPNLYHYDSDRPSAFAKHEASADTLMPILAYEQTRCRINSIRRAPFLEAVAGPQFRDLVEDGKRLFEPSLAELSPEQREALTRSRELPGAVQKVSTNWAYVVSLRGRDEWTEEIRREGIHDGTRELRRLTARYSAAAAPYTAAFGGTHLVPPRQLDALRSEGVALQFVPAPRLPLDHDRWPGLRALTEVGLIRHTLGADLPEQTIEVPAVPEDRHFENFLAFLRDTRVRRIRMQNFLAESQNVSPDLGLMLGKWTDYFRLYEELKAEEDRLRRRGLWVGAASWGSGGLLGAVAGPLLLGEGQALLGAALGALIFAGASSLASDLLRPQMPEPHRKLLGRFQDFQKWQSEVEANNRLERAG